MIAVCVLALFFLRINGWSIYAPSLLQAFDELGKERMKELEGDREQLASVLKEHVYDGQYDLPSGPPTGLALVFIMYMTIFGLLALACLVVAIIFIRKLNSCYSFIRKLTVLFVPKIFPGNDTPIVVWNMWYHSY